MVTNDCEFLTNALANLANAIANAIANACERLTNETTTQRMRGELHIHPLPMFLCFTYSPATAESKMRMLRMITNAFANLANASECPCESCVCLRTLAIAYENNENMLSWRILGACF
jgi:hypothetical protein